MTPPPASPPPSAASATTRSWLDSPRLPLVLSLVGWVTSALLELVHVRAYLWPTASSYCSVGESFDCVSVATSSSAIFLGLPWAIWGAIGFVSLGVAAALRSRWLVPLALVAAVVSAALLLVELTRIGSVCLGCEVVHVTSWLLAFVAWRQRRELSGGFRDFDALWWIFVLPATLVLAALWFLPPYWGAFRYEDAPPYAHGVTPEGWPWLGAEQPKLTIHEFTDYHCPYCALGTVRSLALLARHPELRIVRRQHPRVNCAVETCTSVRLAYCAGEQGQFWRADRWLFAHAPGRKPIDPRQLARDLGLDAERLLACRDRPELIERAMAEEKAARKARIIDTPGYVVDGKKIRANQLRSLVEERTR